MECGDHILGPRGINDIKNRVELGVCRTFSVQSERGVLRKVLHEHSTVRTILHAGHTDLISAIFKFFFKKKYTHGWTMQKIVFDSLRKAGKGSFGPYLWSCGSPDRGSVVISGPQPPKGGRSRWGETGEPGIKASLGHGTAPVRSRAGGVVSRWRRRRGEKVEGGGWVRAAAASDEWRANGRGQGFRAGLATEPLSHLTVSGWGSSGARGHT